MRWGLCRSWEKQLTSPFRVFNARSESVAEKPMFYQLLAKKRCVVPLNGFYEFKSLSNGTKQPYYLHHHDKEGKQLLLAALYDVWTPHHSVENEDTDKYVQENDASVASVTVLTMDAHSKLHWLHDRQPLVLHEDLAKVWLDPKSDPHQVLARIRLECTTPPVQWHAVSNKINTSSYQGSDCSVHIDKVKGSIVSFFGKGGGGRKGGGGGKGGGGSDKGGGKSSSSNSSSSSGSQGHTYNSSTNGSSNKIESAIGKGNAISILDKARLQLNRNVTPKKQKKRQFKYSSSEASNQKIKKKKAGGIMSYMKKKKEEPVVEKVVKKEVVDVTIVDSPVKKEVVAVTIVDSPEVHI